MHLIGESIEDAIISENQKSYVLLLKNQDNIGFHFERVQVENGVSSDDFTELIPNENIKENSKNLTKGIFDVIN